MVLMQRISPLLPIPFYLLPRTTILYVYVFYHLSFPYHFTFYPVLLYYTYTYFMTSPSHTILPSTPYYYIIRIRILSPSPSHTILPSTPYYYIIRYRLPRTTISYVYVFYHLSFPYHFTFYPVLLQYTYTYFITLSFPYHFTFYPVLVNKHIFGLRMRVDVVRLRKTLLLWRWRTCWKKPYYYIELNSLRLGWIHSSSAALYTSVVHGLLLNTRTAFTTSVIHLICLENCNMSFLELYLGLGLPNRDTSFCLQTEESAPKLIWRTHHRNCGASDQTKLQWDRTVVEFFWA
jgi:hypothetical protein